MVTKNKNHTTSVCCVQLADVTFHVWEVEAVTARPSIILPTCRVNEQPAEELLILVANILLAFTEEPHLVKEPCN